MEQERVKKRERKLLHDCFVVFLFLRPMDGTKRRERDGVCFCTYLRACIRPVMTKKAMQKKKETKLKENLMRKNVFQKPRGGKEKKKASYVAE